MNRFHTFIFSLCLLLNSPAPAATLYWDTAEGTGIQGGNANWNNTDTAWNPLADGTDPRIAWTSDDDANFTTGTSIVTLTEAITARSLTQTGSATTTISGASPLNLTTATGINNTSSGTLTIDSNLTLDTPATLFTGTGRIVINGSIGETIPGSGLQKTGTNTLELANANTFTGDINVSNGTILVQNNGALGLGAGTTTATNGGTIALQHGVTVTGETITLTGSGYTGGNNFAGALQSTGTGTGTSTWAGNVNLNGTARVGANGPDSTLVIDGKISGNGTLEIGSLPGATGGGTTVLAGAHGHDFTGSINIVRGTLRFQGANNVLPATTALILNSAGNDKSTVDLNGTQQTVARLAAGASAADRQSVSLITNTSATRSTLITNQTGDGEFYGTLTGNLNFTKLGNGALHFYGPNTSIIDGDLLIENRATIGTFEPVVPAGPTTLSAHSVSLKNTNINTDLYIRGNSAAGSHTLTVREGGLTLENYSIFLNAGDVAGGRLLLQGNLTTIASANGAQILDNTANLNPVRGYVDLGGATRTFTIADGSATNDLNITAAITNGGIIKAGTGLLRLAGNSTYDGTTSINTGIVIAASNQALGSSTGGTSVASGARLLLGDGVIITGETLNLSGNGGDFFGSLQAAANATAEWAGNIILNTEARIGSANTASHLKISGSIQNGTINTLVIAGNGTHTLSGVSTYTGQTQILRGIVKLDAGNNRLPTGTLLNVDSGAAVEDAIFDLNGYQQSVAGLLRSGSGSSTGGSFVRNTNTTQDGTLEITAGGQTYNGILQGGGSLGQLNLTKSGAGTQTLAAANTYTGKTTVSGGTLALSATGSINDSAWIQINTGATLSVATTQTYSKQVITGGGTISGNLIVNGTSLLKPGATTNPSLASITDAGDLTGTLTVNGNLNLLATASATTPRAIFQLGGTNSHTNTPTIASTVTAFSTATADSLYDSIDINGTLGLEAGSILEVELLSGYTPQFGDVFNLLDWNSPNFNINSLGSFTTADLILPTLDNGWFFATDQFIGHGIVYVVPEPGRALLFFAALIPLALQRRRRW
ncbi:hypothetical protein FEM03_23530 [Phragmitibacter flavus]|uniref:PEP-CTERM sorting domain-containing protein n=1 Tax=Phragmitibacter flavus TaxID=2576071 RepID=A0A5R8K7I1_9BACT|nr:autotransporter-associated beta strand repeat-containing protein [Phragmitibacter flavus]TLD68292.1 hypothetical protein FEM03_23530 [Phragmitibacter flavus]